MIKLFEKLIKFAVYAFPVLTGIVILIASNSIIYGFIGLVLGAIISAIAFGLILTIIEIYNVLILINDKLDTSNSKLDAINSNFLYFLDSHENKKENNLNKDHSNHENNKSQITFNSDFKENKKIIDRVEKINDNGESIVTLIYDDDSKYEGELKDDLRHGKGKLQLKDGVSYVGEFKDNVPWNATMYKDQIKTSVYVYGLKRSKKL